MLIAPYYLLSVVKLALEEYPYLVLPLIATTGAIPYDLLLNPEPVPLVLHEASLVNVAGLLLPEHTLALHLVISKPANIGVFVLLVIIYYVVL